MNEIFTKLKRKQQQNDEKTRRNRGETIPFAVKQVATRPGTELSDLRNKFRRAIIDSELQFFNLKIIDRSTFGNYALIFDLT